MLSEYDLQWMDNTVHEIIKEWNTKIKIYTHTSDRSNYDSVMNEFVGDAIVTMVEIDAERKDIYANYSDKHGDIVYGTHDDSDILYAIPNTYNNQPYKPSLFDLVKIDEDIYYIKDCKDRIGETLISICKFVGHQPEIIENDTIIVRGYGWSND